MPIAIAAESYDRPLKSICYLIGAVFIFSIQDVIIKWISGKYPINEIVLIRSCFAIIPILFISHLEGGVHLLRTSHYAGHIIRSFFTAIFTLILNNITVAQKTHPSFTFLFREWRLPSQGDLFLFMVIGLIAAAGFYFLSQAYRLARPSTIAPFEYIAVPLSVIWGFLFWNDILELQSLIGIVLIVGSGLYMFGSKKVLTNIYVLSIFKIKIRK